MKTAILLALCTVGCAKAGLGTGTGTDLSGFLVEDSGTEPRFDQGFFESGIPLDLAGDLANPACMHIDEPLDTTDINWLLSGTSTYDTTGHRIQLTTPGKDQAGSAFYMTPATPTAFDAQFKYYIGDGNGSDGMAFVIAHIVSSTAELGPHGDGSALGYSGMDGYAVEFDTNNSGNEISNNHVGFMRTNTATHLLAQTFSEPLDCNCERQAEVKFTGTHVTVIIDGITALDGVVSSYAPEPDYFGFTGATGSGYDRHAFRDFHLILGPSGTCF